MRILVTGVSGFTGRHFHSFLTSSHTDWEVFGLSRTIPAGMTLSRGCAADLLDAAGTERIIRHLVPDCTLHLAGLTHGTMEELLRANAAATENLLRAHLLHSPSTRILVVSSSAVYGYAGSDPLDESAPLNPVTPYGKSKMEQERVAEYYAEKGLRVSIARPFNLTGPLQSRNFVCGSIIAQACEIRRGERGAIQLRELNSQRDYVDVRDVVRAYLALLAHPGWDRACTGAAFNIGTGTACSVADILALVESVTGMRYSVVTPLREPAPAVPFQVSDSSRIHDLTGWKAEIPLRETLRAMLSAVCPDTRR
jgi:nucleoside-diphosphate-sugar epimerase